MSQSLIHSSPALSRPGIHLSERRIRSRLFKERHRYSVELNLPGIESEVFPEGAISIVLGVALMR